MARLVFAVAFIDLAIVLTILLIAISNGQKTIAILSIIAIVSPPCIAVSVHMAASGRSAQDVVTPLSPLVFAVMMGLMLL